MEPVCQHGVNAKRVLSNDGTQRATAPAQIARPVSTTVARTAELAHVCVNIELLVHIFGFFGRTAGQRLERTTGRDGRSGWMEGRLSAWVEGRQNDDE
jgi:hypothetical protein